jgi:radical SAM protein with 4Fe4S-binding SPASM domain
MEGAIPLPREPLRDSDMLPPLPVPDPMPNRAAYERERELRLASDDLCRANYEKYRASIRVANVDYLPIRMDIENVSRCNFRCGTCQVSEWPKGRRASDMSVDDFKRLIDEQHGLVEIKLQGMGEPLLAGDALFEMIAYARERHIWVRSTTNASLLHLRDNYRKIVDSGINELQVSIDAADKATFEAIRPGSVFERVLDNCRMLNAYSREQGRLCAKMWTVLQRRNAHQVFELIELAAELGFESQAFSQDLTDWGQERWRDITQRDFAVADIDLELGWKMIEAGRRLGVTVAFWKIAAKFDSSHAAGLCAWPFERAYVSSDSRVTPCCMIANPDALEIGRLDAGFTGLWHGESYRRFRQEHIEGRIPEPCRNCYKQQSCS